MNLNAAIREHNRQWEARIVGVMEDLLGRVPSNDELRQHAQLVVFTHHHWAEYRWKGVTLLYRAPLFEFKPIDAPPRFC